MKCVYLEFRWLVCIEFIHYNMFDIFSKYFIIISKLFIIYENIIQIQI